MFNFQVLINEIEEDLEKEKAIMKYCENNKMQYSLEYHNGSVSALTGVLMRLKKLCKNGADC